MVDRFSAGVGLPLYLFLLHFMRQWGLGEIGFMKPGFMVGFAVEGMYIMSMVTA